MKLKIETDRGTVKLESEAGRSVAIMAGGSRLDDEDRAAFIIQAANAHDGLVAALERIRGGRFAHGMAERLSDTEMARIANDALNEAGLGGIISPFAAQVLSA